MTAYEIIPAEVAFEPPATVYSTLAEASEQALALARQHGECWVRSWRSKTLIALFICHEGSAVSVVPMAKPPHTPA